MANGYAELKALTNAAVDTALAHHYGTHEDGTPRMGRPENDEILRMIGQ